LLNYATSPPPASWNPTPIFHHGRARYLRGSNARGVAPFSPGVARHALTSIPGAQASGSPSRSPERISRSPETHLTLSGTYLTLSGTHLALSGTPLTLSGTHLALSGTHLTLSGTLLALSGRPLALSGTLLALFETLLSLFETLLSLSGTPLALCQTLLELSGTPLALSGTLLALSGTPLALSGTLLALSGTLLALSGTHLTLSGMPLALSGTPPWWDSPGVVGSANLLRGNSTPAALRPSARGCAPRATPGKGPRIDTTATRLRPCDATAMGKRSLLPAGCRSISAGGTALRFDGCGGGFPG
jgi:hypothetical protein